MFESFKIFVTWHVTDFKKFCGKFFIPIWVLITHSKDIFHMEKISRRWKIQNFGVWRPNFQRFSDLQNGPYLCIQNGLIRPIVMILAIFCATGVKKAFSEFSLKRTSFQQPSCLEECAQSALTLTASHYPPFLSTIYR